MSKIIVIVSGACGTGKSTTLSLMRPLIGHEVGEVATLETDLFYQMIDPNWSIPWPRAAHYVSIALRNVVRATLHFLDEGFDWIAIASNGLYEKPVVDEFIRPLIEDNRAALHHITLDPGVLEVQERIVRRAGPFDDAKTPEWLESQVRWFRERYGDWTYVLDNESLTPEETVRAMYATVKNGGGRCG
jgi:energy-coupling factor transporter ATP-binding protein EcfA2